MKVITKAGRLLPANVRSLVKRVAFKDQHWAHGSLKRFGTVQDLYYWIADGNKDTLLVLQNFYSVFYPALDTATDGTVSVYNKDGGLLGGKAFSLAHLGATKLRVSTLLKELSAVSDEPYGTLEVNLAIPPAVLSHIQNEKSFYFWDRFYIAYTNGVGQTCFVHGVDRTHIYREGSKAPIEWYKTPKGHQWAPEMPLNITDYQRFNVIMANRTSRTTTTTLTLSDIHNNTLRWEAQIAPKGVHCFELDQQNTAELHPMNIRMRVDGMATRFGRPMVFKEFANGAISAMHC